MQIDEQRPSPAPPPEGQAPQPGADEPVTTGTLFLMILFLMALGGLWLIMYFLLLER